MVIQDSGSGKLDSDDADRIGLLLEKLAERGRITYRPTKDDPAVALHVPGKLDWDAKNLRFTNNAEAGKFVKPVFRKGWELKL